MIATSGYGPLFKAMVSLALLQPLLVLSILAPFASRPSRSGFRCSQSITFSILYDLPSRRSRSAARTLASVRCSARLCGSALHVAVRLKPDWLLWCFAEDWLCRHRFIAQDHQLLGT